MRQPIEVKLAKIASDRELRAQLIRFIDNPMLQFAAIYLLVDYLVDPGIGGWKMANASGLAMVTGVGAIGVARAIAPALPALGEGASSVLKLIPGI